MMLLFTGRLVSVLLNLAGLWVELIKRTFPNGRIFLFSVFIDDGISNNRFDALPNSGRCLGLRIPNRIEALSNVFCINARNNNAGVNNVKR